MSGLESDRSNTAARASARSRKASHETQQTPLRVLLVEDSEDDALLVLRELRRGGYRVSHERVDTAGGMLAALEERDWDLVVSDHAMPGFSAPAALQMLREGGWPDVPFVIVSGHIGEDAAVEVMKAGAHDYVPKDNLARLALVVERALREAEERRQRRRAREELRAAEEKYRSIFENAVEGIFQTSLDGRFVTANPMMARIFGYGSPEEMIQSVHDVAEQHYVNPERRNEFARRLREEGQVFDFEFQILRKSGAVIWVSANARAVRDGVSGGVVGYEGTMEDITERKRAEEELRRSLERLMALHEAGSILGSTLEPEEIGTRLLGIMRRISGFAAAAISMRDDATGRLAVWRSIGLDDLETGVRYAPAIRNAQEAAMEKDATQVFVPAVEASPDGAHTVPSVGLCLPLRVRERVMGLLEVYGPEELAERGVVEILESLTSQAASALENSRLYRELMERERKLQELVGKILVAQEEERRRVSYDVHDGLAQVAAAAHQHLQAFAHYHPPGTEEGREDLEYVSGLVRRTVGEARRIIANLRPTALDDFGLKSAIRLHLDALRAEGWEIYYRDGLDDERLPALTETAIFRVVQEALNNIAKHAGTRRVKLSLEKRTAQGVTGNLAAPMAPDERGKIRLTVRDYGRGFGPEHTGGGGGPGERVGLTGMRERIALLGGHFRIASSPGVGTLLVAEIPLLAGPAGAKAGDVLGPSAAGGPTDGARKALGGGADER